jgi:hypothetical protein
VISHWNELARNPDGSDVRERMRLETLQSSKENKIRFVKIEGYKVPAGLGVQVSETFFRTMALAKNVKLEEVKCEVVSHQTIAAEQHRKWEEDQ